MVPWLAPVESEARRPSTPASTRPPLLTGRASRGIEKRLIKVGYDLVADPESFLVDKQSHLLPGEAERTMGSEPPRASRASNP